MLLFFIFCAKAQSSMKCPQQISMPSGIQHWLEEQLEARGIDAAIYSKYILTVLCNNNSSNPPIKPKDSCVKNLIDELSAKLNGYQEKGQLLYADLPSKNLDDNQPQSLQEKAFRYYTAFPPLSSKPKADYIYSTFGPSSTVWSGKRVLGSCVGKNFTYSEGNNQDCKLNNNKLYWLEENKENNGCNRDGKDKMRSRSTVKQQTPEKAYRNMAKSLDRKDDFNRKSEMSKSRRLYQQSNELVSEDIQALWATEKSSDDLTGCDQELPMNFQELLESPEAPKTSLDFSRCIGTKQQSSFIQCGTNITSSIWSEKAEDTMDCSMIGETSNDLNLSLSFNKSVWSLPNDASNNRFEVLQELEGSQKSNIWSTGKRNFFSNDSWKAVGNNETKESSGDLGKWSDVEGTSLLLNDADNFFSSIGSNLHSSLITLNHNKEDSSFTEVIPKTLNVGFCATKDIINTEPAFNHSDNSTWKKEEENLLTSMKTHFRPIKQEKIEIVPPTIVRLRRSRSAFPDGTTFPISNRLDKPNFYRSPGGGLYLGSDMNTKYMEFSGANNDTPSEFVPKFQVRQNEKFCQTEVSMWPSNNFVELDGEELFFPEDEKLVQRMVEEDEVEEEEEENTLWREETCIKVDGWMATWPTSGIWSNKPSIQQIWCGGSVWNPGTGSAESEKPDISSGDVQGGDGDQYTQLRNEWTQEAEELLSDISQHLYLANYMESQPPKLIEVEPKPNEPTVIVRGVSQNRKRRHWSSQHGANCPPPHSQVSRSRPLTL